jgi:hypothetical protein
MPNLLQALRDTYLTNPAKAFNMLLEICKAIDEGLIIELPCKVGTTVFTTRWWDNVDEKCTDSKGKKFFRTIQRPKITKESFSPFSLDYSGFGRTVFLTREAAEEKLEGEKK